MELEVSNSGSLSCIFKRRAPGLPRFPITGEEHQTVRLMISLGLNPLENLEEIVIDWNAFQIFILGVGSKNRDRAAVHIDRRPAESFDLARAESRIDRG